MFQIASFFQLKNNKCHRQSTAWGVEGLNPKLPPPLTNTNLNRVEGLDLNWTNFCMYFKNCIHIYQIFPAVYRQNIPAKNGKICLRGQLKRGPRAEECQHAKCLIDRLRVQKYTCLWVGTILPNTTKCTCLEIWKKMTQNDIILELKCIRTLQLP